MRRALIVVCLATLAPLTLGTEAQGYVLSKHRARDVTRTVLREWIHPAFRWHDSIRRTGPCERRSTRRVRCRWTISDPTYSCQGTVLVSVRKRDALYSLDRAPYCAPVTPPPAPTT